MDDDALYDMVKDAEAARAQEQLAAGSVEQAWLASVRRHDRLWDATLAASGETLACRRGCAWCCHFRVGVRAEEALRLADVVRARGDGASVLARAASQAATLAGLSPERRLRTNLACPLLVSGACSVYEDRPMACRSFHATEVEGCEASYEDPDRDDIGQAFVGAVAAVTTGHEDGWVAALTVRGLDVEVYELNAALAEALVSDAPARRYAAGEAAFLSASLDR